MAQNILPKNPGALVVLAGKCSAGLTTYATTLKITQITAAGLDADASLLQTAVGDFNATRAARTAATAAMHAASDAAKTFLSHGARGARGALGAGLFAKLGVGGLDGQHHRRARGPARAAGVGECAGGVPHRESGLCGGRAAHRVHRRAGHERGEGVGRCARRRGRGR